MAQAATAAHKADFFIYSIFLLLLFILCLFYFRPSFCRIFARNALVFALLVIRLIAAVTSSEKLCLSWAKLFHIPVPAAAFRPHFCSKCGYSALFVVFFHIFANFVAVLLFPHPFGHVFAQNAAVFALLVIRLIAAVTSSEKLCLSWAKLFHIPVPAAAFRPHFCSKRGNFSLSVTICSHCGFIQR